MAVRATDALGRYVVDSVRTGSYGVGANPPVAYAFNRGNTFVSVAAGATATVDFALSRDTSGPDTTHTAGGPVASVTIRAGTVGGSTSVAVGDSIPLAADLRNASGDLLLDRAVTWTVSDSTIAWFQYIVGQFAGMRAQRSGAVSVTATSEGKSGSVGLTVR